MFKNLGRLIVFGLCSLVLGVAQAQSANDALANILQKLNSMTANFVQVTYDSRGKALQKSTGQMALQRPGRFRWQTQSPDNQIIIANGETIWIYNADLQQATKQSQAQQSNQANPASLLSGSTDTLQQHFKVSLLKPAKGQQTFQLKPNNKKAMFHSIKLNFLQNELKSMTVLDNLGQQTVFNFSQVHINPPLNSSLFEFNPPKGTDIIAQ